MPVEPRLRMLVRQFSTLSTEQQGHRLRPIEGGFEKQRQRLGEEAPECIVGPFHSVLDERGGTAYIRHAPEQEASGALWALPLHCLSVLVPAPREQQYSGHAATVVHWHPEDRRESRCSNPVLIGRMRQRVERWLHVRAGDQRDGDVSGDRMRTGWRMQYEFASTTHHQDTRLGSGHPGPSSTFQHRRSSAFRPAAFEDCTGYRTTSPRSWLCWVANASERTTPWRPWLVRPRPTRYVGHPTVCHGTGPPYHPRRSDSSDCVDRRCPPLPRCSSRKFLVPRRIPMEHHMTPE